MPRREPKPNLNLAAEELIAEEIALKDKGEVMVGCWPPEGLGPQVNHRRFLFDNPRRTQVAGELDPVGGGCWHMLRNRCACPCHATERLEAAAG